MLKNLKGKLKGIFAGKNSKRKSQPVYDPEVPREERKPGHVRVLNEILEMSQTDGEEHVGRESPRYVRRDGIEVSDPDLADSGINIIPLEGEAGMSEKERRLSRVIHGANLYELITSGKLDPRLARQVLRKYNESLSPAFDQYLKANPGSTGIERINIDFIPAMERGGYITASGKKSVQAAKK